MSARDVEEIYRANPPHPVASRALNLRLHPDPVLRTVCYPMERFDQWLSDVVDEMLSLMRIHDGIGLAAPQVGITKRFFVAQIGRRSICLANPVLVSSQGSDQMTEGCLSLPGVQVNIERNLQIEVQGFDVHGRAQRHRVDGLWARVMQHEMDHLDGVLISDHQAKNAADS
jgi:peptide deformylase